MSVNDAPSKATRALSHEDVQRIFEAGRQGLPLAGLL